MMEWHTCWSQKPNFKGSNPFSDTKWHHRLMVRTRDFQSRNTGSNPVGVTSIWAGMQVVKASGL